MAMSQEQQKKVAAVIIFAVTFFYVYFKYMLAPKQDAIVKVEAELSTVLARVEELKMTASRLPALRRETEELDVQVAKVERRLPRTRNIEDIIRTVTELAKKSNVAFSSFAPGGESAQQYYTEVPFTLNVTGTMHSIAKFLAVMGQQERIFSAKNLSLSFSPNPQKGHTVSGSFTLYAFVYNG